MDFDQVDPKLQEQAKNCKTPEEMLDLAKEAGYELSLDELDGVAAGKHWACACDEEYTSYNPCN